MAGGPLAFLYSWGDSAAAKPTVTDAATGKTVSVTKASGDGVAAGVWRLATLEGGSYEIK